MADASLRAEEDKRRGEHRALSTIPVRAAPPVTDIAVDPPRL